MRLSYIIRRKNILKLVFLLPLLVLYSCKPPLDVLDQDIIEARPTEWLISQNEVMDGGPGKDGIPALTDPLMVPVNEINYLDADDLVIGIRIGDKIMAFPHRILDQHEIINMLPMTIPFILSYCPLTGSGMAWKAPVYADNQTYGVSGLLYNSNLILYDRETDSYWSQMMMKCVSGTLIREEAEMIHVIETEWATWKEMYPNSLVVSNNTGLNRNYDVYPYGDYKSSDTLIFSVNNEDDRLHKKVRIHGVISVSGTKAYVIRNYPGSIQVMNDRVYNLDIVLALNAERNFAVSFERTLEDGTSLVFTSVQDSLPVVMKDNEGTMWDIFGYAVDGPRAGSRLTPTISFNAYWFAWAAFFHAPIL